MVLLRRRSDLPSLDGMVLVAQVANTAARAMPYCEGDESAANWAAK